MKEGEPRKSRLLEHRISDIHEGFSDAPPNDFTRREAALLTGINAASLVVGTGFAGELAFNESSSHESHQQTGPKNHGEIHAQEIGETSEVADAEWWRKVWYVTPKSLVGKNVDNNLEWSYIQPDTQSNINLVNPKSLPKILPPIPFHKNLEQMLKAKKELTKHAPGASQEAKFYDSLDESYANLFQKKEIRKMDLNEFRGLIEKESQVVLAELSQKQSQIITTYISKHLEALGWKQGTPAREKFEEALGRYLDSLAKSITPDLMLAYISTELMPAPDRGMAMLEFLTEHAGVEFIERIPALGDSELSYGPFQLTPYAVGENGSVTTLLKAMHSDLVPDSLEKFTSIEHHLRAGLLFAFHNILALVQDTCKEGRYEELVTLLEGAGSEKSTGNSSVFMEFISAAHHRPESALKAMNKWLVENRPLPTEKRNKSLAPFFKKGEEDQEDKRYAEKARRCLENIRQA